MKTLVFDISKFRMCFRQQLLDYGYTTSSIPKLIELEVAVDHYCDDLKADRIGGLPSKMFLIDIQQKLNEIAVPLNEEWFMTLSDFVPYILDEYQQIALCSLTSDIVVNFKSVKTIYEEYLGLEVLKFFAGEGFGERKLFIVLNINDFNIKGINYE